MFPLFYVDLLVKNLDYRMANMLYLINFVTKQLCKAVFAYLQVSRSVLYSCLVPK